MRNCISSSCVEIKTKKKQGNGWNEEDDEGTRGDQVQPSIYIYIYYDIWTLVLVPSFRNRTLPLLSVGTGSLPGIRIHVTH